MNDYLMWREARTRMAGLRAEASRSRLAGELRRSRRGSGGYSVLIGGWWTGREEKIVDRDVGEVCCA